MNQLLTEYPLWWLIFGVALAAGYTYLLYRPQENAPWTKTTHYTLAALRFTLVLLIVFLLLNPYIRQISNYFEKPTVVLAIDNSQSIPLTIDSTQVRKTLQELTQLQSQLQEAGYEVVTQDLTTDNFTTNLPTAANSFSASTTNLSNLLENITQTFENKNLTDIVLLSDGIYNQGTSPLFQSYKIPVHTIGIGDSVVPKDISIKAVYHNELAYLGNKFPINAEISQAGFEGKTVEVLLQQNGNIISRQALNFEQGKDIYRVDFLVDATQKGMQHYTLSIAQQTGEFTAKNNLRHVYIDVLDGKEKILIVAAAPHPDIKAMRSALESKENYQVDLHIPNLIENMYKPTEKYNLVILHNIPNRNGIAMPFYNELLNKQQALLYIVGTESNLSLLNKNLPYLKINSRGLQTDKVFPSFNPNFNTFTFEEIQRNKFKKYPPVNTIFASYEVAPTAQVLLYQRVGSVQTQNPLLVLHDNQGQKSGAFLAEGWWQWRLQEYTQDEKHEAFDELLLKTVQYLATKEDKRKFRVRPTSADENTESVTFETEVYNDIYEKIYGQKIELVVSNEKKAVQNYTYTNSDANFRYRINGLIQGVYQFKATTVLNGKTETSTGEFTVKEPQTESINTVADFNLLRQLAKQTNGTFVHYSQTQQLASQLLAKKPVSIIHSSENMEELIHLKWWFFLLVTLASVEWFVRKFRGAY